MLACIGLTCKAHHGDANEWKCRDLINLIQADPAIASTLNLHVPCFTVEGNPPIADISHPEFWALKDSILSSEVSVLLTTGALGLDLLPMVESVYYAQTSSEDPALLSHYRDMAFLSLSRCWDILHVVTAEDLIKGILGIADTDHAKNVEERLKEGGGANRTEKEDGE